MWQGHLSSHVLCLARFSPYDSDHSRSKWKYSRPLDAFESGTPLLLRSFGEILFCFIVNFLKPLQKQMRVYLWMEYICINKVLIHVRFLTYCSVSPGCVFKWGNWGCIPLTRSSNMGGKKLHKWHIWAIRKIGTKTIDKNFVLMLNILKLKAPF